MERVQDAEKAKPALQACFVPQWGRGQGRAKQPSRGRNKYHQTMYRDLEPGTNLRDWVVWPVRAVCYSWAALSSYDSKTRYKHYVFSGSVR